MSLFIGLMSGTSIDAIDAVITEFPATGGIHIHATHTHAWSSALRRTLLKLTQITKEHSTLHEIAVLDHQVGEFFAQAVLGVLAVAHLAPHEITAIGSPGQTLYHHPQGKPAYTWQLGDPSIIAQITGIPTVADFRRRDVAAGGQGAPLTPAFHQALLRSATENRIVLNIGGIANITFLPADTRKPTIGFDTGPGNALLDAHIYQQRGEYLDTQGKWAATGQVRSDLLNLLLQDTYFAQPHPKSTGRDYFNLTWLKHRLDTFASPIPPEDIQATLHQLTITSIVNAVAPYAPQRLLVCGGGSHNPLLMNGLATGLPQCVVESTATQGIDPDWVEAVSFAWLAKCRLEELPSNLPAVTGARQAVVLGAIYL